MPCRKNNLNLSDHLYAWKSFKNQCCYIIDNRTVDDLVREAEDFKKPTEGKKKGQLKPAVSFDQEPPQGKILVVLKRGEIKMEN